MSTAGAANPLDDPTADPFEIAREAAAALAAATGVEPFSLLQLTTSYVRPRPDVEVPGKDHRFGFATDETLDYLAEHPDLELWAYSPLVQGAYDRPDRPFPEAYAAAFEEFADGIDPDGFVVCAYRPA